MLRYIVSALVVVCVLAGGIMFLGAVAQSQEEELSCDELLLCVCHNRNHTRVVACEYDEDGFLIDSCKRNERGPIEIITFDYLECTAPEPTPTPEPTL